MTEGEGGGGRGMVYWTEQHWCGQPMKWQCLLVVKQQIILMHFKLIAVFWRFARDSWML